MRSKMPCNLSMPGWTSVMNALTHGEQIGCAGGVWKSCLIVREVRSDEGIRDYIDLKGWCEKSERRTLLTRMPSSPLWGKGPVQ